MPHIILASGSPRRKQLLELLGLTFEVIPSIYEEHMEEDMPPLELAKKLSLGKARDVAKDHPESLVIGADTFVSFQGSLLGKPHTVENAQKTLQMLRGNTHEVITGVTMIQGEKCISESVLTSVVFRDLTDAEIDGYIAKEHVLDAAGGYKIQGLGACLIERIEGDYTNVIGLPVGKVTEMLKAFGVAVL